MKRHLFTAAAIAALALSGPALAADNFQVKDGNSVMITKSSKDVSGIHHERQIMEGVTAGGVVTQIKVLADGTLAADPAAASEAKLEQVRALLSGTVNVSLSGVSTAANQTTANSTLSSILSAVQAATPGGTNIIGDVGSASFSVTCSTLTLPGTGGTYASGDLVANSATAGSVTPVTCVVARYSGGPLTITRARILTSTTGLANANFRLHEYTATPTVTNGNDGVFLSTASGHFCRIDVTVDQAFSNGASGSGVPITGSGCTQVLSATQTINLLVEARGAYAWTAAQTLTITLEGFN